MFKKISAVLLGATSLFTTQVFSTPTQVMPQGQAVIYSLAPNTPLALQNPLTWTISFNCTITSSPINNSIDITVVNGSGTINGTRLSKNQSITWNESPGDVVKVVAEPGAKVQLINLGSQIVQAACAPAK